MESITLKLSIEEINLILEGLGNLPFVRVSAVISNIQKQAAEQLSGAVQTARHPLVNGRRLGGRP